jgi:purine-binding chemotaxis protein CheW
VTEMERKHQQAEHGSAMVDLDQPAKAIDEFLESLLESVQEYHPAQEVKVADPAPAKPVVQQETVSEVVSEVAVEQQVESADEGPEKALPAWCDQPFQCLLFRAGDAEFAIPLAELSGIVKWDVPPRKLPGQPQWHKGVMQYREGKTSVVDLVRLLLGEHASREEANFIIVFDEGRFGLICSELFRPVTLVKEQVKWRMQRRQRPWMLGTLREQLCPLLDVAALAAMLR